MSATASSKKEVLETLPIWTPGWMLGPFEILPDLKVIFPHGVREITKHQRSGWIDIRVDHQRVRMPFTLGGRWNYDMIRNLKPQRCAQLTMRNLHPELMQAKYANHIGYFIIKGLVFDQAVGFGTDYNTY